MIHARDYSTGSPPVSTTQPDWEDRLFRLKTLTLTQSIFSLARNATLRGDIQANASHILFNDSRVFVDNKDGEGVATEIKGGNRLHPRRRAVAITAIFTSLTIRNWTLAR
ncbi:hypothetical protein Q8004_10255 [Edwardsiella piscicida]|nr:hypothetical protein Q8004_10255 [Edwardsiella piscicida]